MHAVMSLSLECALSFGSRVSGCARRTCVVNSVIPSVTVLVEAVRNAVKHADPSRIDVRLSAPDGAFVLEVVNDGARAGRGSPPRGRTGMGLRLAAFEALEHGGIVEFGPVGADEWRVRLVVARGGP